MNLRVDAANLGGFGDTGHGKQIGAHTEIAFLLRGFLAYCFVGAAHDAFQLAIDLAFGPEGP